jgi:AcrR family transcriptional regulator
MAPRRYRMTARRTAAEDTKRRILEATLDLHTEKGIFGTSWQDIAARADVAIGTVYKHFPSLDALVPACGELLMERTRPPSPEDGPRIVGDAVGLEPRLQRVAAELFAFYERAGASLKIDARERALPAVREWETYLRATIAALVELAVAPANPTDAAIRLVGALFDPATYGAMRARGIKPRDAASSVGTIAARWIEHDRRNPPTRTRKKGPSSAGKRSRPR